MALSEVTQRGVKANAMHGGLSNSVIQPPSNCVAARPRPADDDADAAETRAAR
jgi:hypothetical protein